MSRAPFTIREQLGAAFLLILLLFAANLAVHSWAGARRDRSLDVVRAATARRALVVALEREIEDRAREVSVLEHVTLSREQLDAVSARLGRVLTLVEALERDPSAAERGSTRTLRESTQSLVASWRGFYETARRRPAEGARRERAGAEATAGPTERAAVSAALADLRSIQEQRSDAGTQEFGRISRLTDRVGLATFLLSIAVASTLSALSWRRIAHSLATLEEGARRLSDGDMEHRIPLTRRDEFGDVASAFNTMAGNLARALGEAREARHVAERATRAKSAFLANMTHEFRTPMTSILGYAGFIREDARERQLEEIAEDAATIERSGRHMLTLVNDLLDLARIESGRMTLSIEEFDLEGLVRSVAATLQPLLDEHANQLAVTLPPDAGTMTADPVKVRQTLFNLLGNAAKFTDAGTIALTVERVRRDDGDERVVFVVRDTGIGIAADRLASIFEEYEQADASVSRKYGGTGLGLAITQRFCRMMGGEISVASELGRGTTFTVDLPAVVTAGQPQGAVVSLSPPAADERDAARTTPALLESA